MEKTNNQFTPKSLTTLAGEKRREIRKWWVDNGRPKDVCTLYNNGGLIYTLGRPYIPGMFLEAPALLEKFPFEEIVRKIGKFKLIHQCNSIPLSGYVTFVVECRDKVCRIGTFPRSISYLIMTEGGDFMLNSMGAGLSAEVLKEK